MAYVLTNPDNTVNFIGDELEPWLDLGNVIVHEMRRKSSAEVINGIPPEHCVWDEREEVVRDEREHPYLVKPVNQFFGDKQEEEKAYADSLRARRDSLLRTSDARVAAMDNPHLNVEAWKKYRQELRDVPSQKGFPYNVVWPDEPSY